MSSIWKKKTDYDSKLYEEVDSFFENLHDNETLEYRSVQHTMALDIVDAIKNKEILLMEAEVGSGKSWGYLVPLLYASKNNENFKGFLISTSSIALQEQLKTEIENISKMIGIDIPVTIAKGRNNFICKKRLDDYIRHHEEDEKLKELEKKVNSGHIDKEEYQDIPSHIWKRININYVNCYNCVYKDSCEYMLNRKKWPGSKYVICNHDLLVESLKRDNNDLILQDPSILVVDEAHNLEDKVRNSYKNSISKSYLEALILKIDFMISEDESLDTYEDNLIIESLNKVFRMISTKAKYKYRKNAKENIEVFDEETSGFDLSLPLKEEIIKLNKMLARFINNATNYKYLDKRLIASINTLKSYASVFKDLVSDNSKNIYWVSFLPNTKDHITLEYVRKDIYKEASRLLGNNTYGKVFTSATMTTGSGDYSYFANNLGLDRINGIPIIKEFPGKSPFDYDNNALLYLSDDCLSPKSLDRDLYLDTLASKIDELINITEGRSLVLFTSKEDMRRVYQKVTMNNYDFNIMLQTDDVSADTLKERFKEDKQSVLFATGSFFEGIDVKGEALENVIITKLPFPVVNPIIEEKASHFRDGFREVYLPEMIIKLKQGVGRLIRSSTDKGIVSILDPRYKEYEDVILESLPFNNVTTDIEEVKDFATNKIGITKVKK